MYLIFAVTLLYYFALNHGIWWLGSDALIRQYYISNKYKTKPEMFKFSEERKKMSWIFDEQHEVFSSHQCYISTFFPFFFCEELYLYIFYSFNQIVGNISHSSTNHQRFSQKTQSKWFLLLVIWILNPREKKRQYLWIHVFWIE